MIKHEIKVEISKSEDLKNIIEKAYFEDGFGGKLIGKKHFLTIKENDDDVNWVIFKGLHDATTKIVNDDIIDGTMRFIIDESQDDIRLYPVSIYCIKDNDRYIFY